MSNLSRLAEDVVVWSTSEFSFVELEDDISSPSSAMPQKKNPDVLEITRARAAEAAGYTGAILGIVGGLASGYGRDLQRTKPLLWMVSDAGVSALLAVQSVLGGMRVNKVRMRRVAEASDLVALDVAERLVLEHDVPFRTAHGTAALLVQHARAIRKPVRKMTAGDVKGALRKGGLHLYETVSVPRRIGSEDTACHNVVPWARPVPAWPDLEGLVGVRGAEAHDICP